MELSATCSLSQPLTLVDFAPASIKRRVMARIIDIVVHYAVSIVAGFTIGVMLVMLALLAGLPAERLIDQMTGESIAGSVLVGLGYILYAAVCEGLHGATLGKRIVGIHVVKDDGSPCSFKAASVRSFWFLVDGIFLGLVGILAMGRSSLKQRPGDTAAHTVVEQTNRSKYAPRSDRIFVASFLAALAADGVLCAIGYLWPLLF